MNRLIKFLILGVLSLCGACANHTATTTRYKAYVFDGLNVPSFVEGKFSVIDIDHGQGVVQFYGGKLYADLERCQDGWNCIFAGILKFAVPKNWVGETKQWEYEGYMYTVKDQPSLDQKSDADAYFILAQKKENYSGSRLVPPVIFLYSPKQGLLSITLLTSDEMNQLIPVTYIKVIQ
jgi:hypothetical protein